MVVDKPSGIPVHGGDQRSPSDVVHRIAEWLRERARSEYLGVHQRLDLGTSGVLVFVRRAALNPPVAEDFETGRVEKQYIAAIQVEPRSPLSRRDSLTLEHRIAPEGRRMRVGKLGKPCTAHCKVIARRGEQALVVLQPQTGRTHQLRVQLAAVQAAIVGDSEYGSVRAPRMLLHASSLRLPSLNRRFESPTPRLFQDWFEGSDSLGEHAELRSRLADAAVLRYPLLASTDALRWVNGWGDSLAGLTIDWYAGHTVLCVTGAEAVERHTELQELLIELGASSVYLKRVPRADLRRVERREFAPELPLAGDAPGQPLVVREGAAQFEVALGDGFSTGLFVDQRENRVRVLGWSSAQSVLNLFCYTGSFSVAAALGGARRVTSVDISGRALARARRNFIQNGLEPSAHAFVRMDAVRFLERALGRKERYGLIVLDPPSFSSTGRSGVFRVDRDYSRLAELALGVLTPGGRLLAITNHRRLSQAALRKLTLRAAERAGRSIAQAKDLQSGLDCPDGTLGPEPSRALLLTVV